MGDSSEIEKLKGIAQRLLADKKEWIATKSSLEKQAEKLESEKESIRKKAIDLVHKVKEERNKFSESEAKLSSVNDTVQTLKASEEQLHKKLESSESSIQELLVYKDEMHSLKQKMNSKDGSHAEALERLNESLEEKEKECEALKKTKGQEATKAQELLEAGHAQALKQLNDSLEEKKKAYKEEVHSLKEEMNSKDGSHAEALERLNECLEEKKKECEALRKKQEEITAQSSQESAKAQEQLKTIQGQLDSVFADSKERLHKAAEKEVEAEEERNKASLDKIERYRTLTGALKTKLTEMEKRSKSAEEQAQILKGSLSKAKETISRVSATEENDKTVVGVLKDENAKLKAELEQNNKRHHIREVELSASVKNLESDEHLPFWMATAVGFSVPNGPRMAAVLSKSVATDSGR